MKIIFTNLLLVLLIVSCKNNSENLGNVSESLNPEKPEYALVIHGGAGVMRREQMSAEQDAQYRAILHKVLETGEQILSNGGSSLEAVSACIQIMEDSPLFNSGRGAVFTHNEENELDASVMVGSDLTAGAVGGVKVVKNPITAAIAVMKHSNHVLLVGKGAEEFAAKQNLEIVDPDYFKTEGNLQRVRSAKKSEMGTGFLFEHTDYKYGTVGCVALDKSGDIAAGTSTGGMTNKRWNRIGDSPIIGAGTYANNNTCGVSCTGHGEYFIRYAVAYDLSAQMEYAGKSLNEAADFIINDKLKKAGGGGGLVALDKYGNVSMPFNTEGMFRGYSKAGKRYVAIYNDEKDSNE